MTLGNWRKVGQIGCQHPVNQFAHPRSVSSASNEISALLQLRKSVGHRDGALADSEKGVIVFRIAHPDGIVSRQREVIERREQTAGLVDAWWQHHHRALVEDDLLLETQLPDLIEHDGFMRLPRRHDDVADGEWAHATLTECANQDLWCRFTELREAPIGRVVQHSSVLGDDAIEQIGS